MEQPKIVDLIGKCQRNSTKFTSFEILPRDDFDIKHYKIDRDVPLFFSIVWKTDSHVDWSNINEENVGKIPAVKLALNLKAIGENVLLHLTCIGMRKDMLKTILDYLKMNDIKNVLLLRGDGAPNNSSEYFNYVSEMINFIKTFYGNYFCMGIAGFPNGQSDPSKDAIEMKYLKEKVDAGADFIITQIFFESNDFLMYVKNCKDAEIEIPIIPGICLFTSYMSLVKMAELTKVIVPQSVLEKIQDKENDNITMIMSNIYIEMLNELENNISLFPGIHWFTLNNIQPVIQFYKENKMLIAN